MPVLTTIPAAELDELKERLDRLAEDETQLRQLPDEVQTFLRYASQVLHTEITVETRLRRVFDEVSRAKREPKDGIADPKRAEAPGPGEDELERRVAERRAEWRAANQRLRLELEERARAEASATTQLKLAEIFFDNSVSGLAILDRNYNFLRVNQAYARSARREISEFTGRNHFEMYRSDAKLIFDEVVRSKRGFETLERPFVYPDQPERGTTYWDWTLVPVLDAAGEVEYLVFSLYEVTERKRAELAVARANRALRLLSECNQALVRATEEAALLNEVCRVAVEAGGFRMAWVGLAEHDEGRTLRPAARAGLDSGYLDSANLSWGDDERGRGACGTAVRTGQPCIVRDISSDPAFAPWREAAAESGYNSVVALPLFCEGRTLGALGIYSAEADAFDTTEVEILRELAGDLAFGITAMRTRAKRDHAEAALRQSEKSLKEAQRVAYLGNWDLDLQQNVLSWSDEIYRIFEIDPDRFGASYEAFLEVVHPDDRAFVNTAYTESVRLRTPYDIVHRLLMPDGRLKYVNERCETFYDENGRPLRSLGTVQDITERKRADDALRHSERLTSALNRIANVFLTLPDEMYEGTLAVVLELTESSLGMFGFIAEGGDLVMPSLTRDVWDACRVAGKSIVFPASTWGASAWGRAIREKRAVSTDGPFGLPTGHIQINHFLAVPIVMGDAAIGLLSVANKEGGYTEGDQDVLENVARFIAPVLHARLQRDRQERDRKKAEDALRESERRYREVFENSSECIFILDVTSEGRFKFVALNPAHEKAMGYASAELSGRFVDDALPEALATQVSTNYRRCLETGQPLSFDEDLDLPIGRRSFQTVLIPVRNSAGDIYRMVGVARDITEQRRLEVELRRLAAAIEQAAETIVVTDPQAVIQYVNPAFSRVTGYSREEAIGQNPRILQSGTHPRAFYTELWATLSRGEVWHGRFINKRKDGSHYEEDATISPVRDERGEVAHYVAVKRDVTQEVALEDQLRQSQKMEAIGRLAGGVAHDFNNLLGVILGYAELLLHTTHAADPRRDRLQEIAKAANRAASLTRQLLAFSRKQVLELTVLDLNELVKGLEKMLARLLGEDIDLRTPSAPGLGKVRADAGQIEQAIMNLAVNARDAMPDGGHLTIETTNVELDDEYAQRHEGAKPGPYVMLSVSDSGCGMTPETQRRIFEPFFTTKELGKGTGLGLSTVYGVVKQSHGHIWVYSEVGLGTTFKIYLPRVDEVAEAAVRRDAAAAAASGSETVLLVEDDAALRQLTRELLEATGYTVLAAAGGIEALSIADGHRGRVDLLLTDVVMPDMNGPDLAQRLTDRRPEARVLFMSGYTDDAIAHHGILNPGTLLLAKPFTAATLGRKVREALGNGSRT